MPLFCEQIARGGPVTLTDPDMTRFVMTLQEAVRLVLKSLRIAHGGEVFVTRMPVVRIVDLVEELIELAPGEVRSYDLEMGSLVGAGEIDAFVQRVGRLDPQAVS